MNIDEQIRATLVASTEDVVGGPDLGHAVRAGRLRRRRRAATVGVAALAVTGLAVGTAYQVARGPSHEQAREGTHVAGAPTYRDFVPGTDIDEALQGVVADDLPGIGSADLVDAYEWTHGKEIANVAQANAWTLRYPSGDQRLFVGLRKPAGSGSVTCRDGGYETDRGEPECTRVDLPDGGYLVNDSFTGSSYHHQDQLDYVFKTTRVRPDGFMVSVDQVIRIDRGPDDYRDAWHRALRAVAYTPAELRPLLTDPRLDFPDPVG